ncbi:hypothetical protein Ocin01_18413 [Orchesella cincta]|uniref:Tyr recombinase domain-containing protein n=1 Tax=Orchesella cincta TaxID=48709 RepID=A0A1D2M5L7_ORCCI|nr:hypothetical protein Ocin01_18413 [Orchesella cincta]
MRSGIRILLRIDSVTAIAYINKYGGCRSDVNLNVAREIWCWCEERNILLYSTYINTKDNYEADAASRLSTDSTDFTLDIQSYEKIVATFGQPQIDLFASWNRHCGGSFMEYTGMETSFTSNHVTSSCCNFGSGLSLSSEIRSILQASCSQSTWKQYESVYKSYQKFCVSLNQNPMLPNINLVLQYLNYLYKDGKGYVSINAARSALSTLLGSVDGTTIGSHPLVTRFLKGISRLRPPSCKYSITWDPQIVLDYISKLESNDMLSLRALSVKLVSLILLCTGQRVQTLANIKISEIQAESSVVFILVESRLKTSKPGKGLTIRLPRFDDVNICVVNCLQVYLQRTSAIRKSQHLFIQSVAPFEKASSQTISKWASEMLKLAGINTNMFTAHSYRHAATSKAAGLGVSLDSIYKAAGWTNRSNVFRKFYNRPLCNNLEFAQRVFDGKCTEGSDK